MSKQDGSAIRILELINKKVLVPSTKRTCYKCGAKGFTSTMKRVHFRMPKKYVYQCRWGCSIKSTSHE